MQLGLGILAVIIIPLTVAVFRVLQRLDRIEGKHELTDQRMGYIEADGKRQDVQLNEMAATLKEVRDTALRIEVTLSQKKP